MAKSLTCKCGYEAKAETVEAVMNDIGGHAEQVHPDWEMTPEFVDNLKAQIQDV